MNGLAQGPGPCVTRRFLASTKNNNKIGTTVSKNCQIKRHQKFNIAVNQQQQHQRTSLSSSSFSRNLLSGELFRFKSKEINKNQKILHHIGQLTVDGEEVLSCVGPHTAAAPSLSSAWSQ